MYEEGDFEEVYEAYSQLLSNTINYLHRFAAHATIWVIVYLCCCVVVYWRGAPRKGLRGSAAAKRALLVIAHPDDECMFFGPTVYGLLQHAVELHVLCLSDGNSDGLGHVRRKELWKACTSLGIPAANICLVTDDRMPDKMGARWPSPVVSQIILQFVESYDIDALIVFDKYGVSGHTNHTSLFFGVAYLFVENLIPNNCSVYTLDSVNVMRKYWGLLDLPLSYIFSSDRYFLTWRQSRRVVRSMRRHRSQMVWFRHLYVVFSRYMFINTLRRVTLVDIELELTVDD